MRPLGSLALLEVVLMLLRRSLGGFPRAQARVVSMLAESAVTVKPVPITVLSGFLGAGKTTFLTHCLENRKSVSYGLILNDMASVNIDSKLVRKQTMNSDVESVELQNGCVCCTLADDLMASVSNLIDISDQKKTAYDHIIVECTGIAEPRKIRELFQESEDMGSPLLTRARLDTMATVVDARTFMDVFGSEAVFSENSDLVFTAKERASMGQVLDNEDGIGLRKVTELLLEQVECADVVIINKVDLLESDAQLAIVRRIVSSVNPTARVLTCVRGELEEALVVGCGKGEGAASWGMLDEHRLMVGAVERQGKEAKEAALLVHDEATCTDPTHDHSHGGMDHDHASCTDPTHDHSHGVDHDEATCTDPTHDHSHGSHDHDHGRTTADERFGITSFVYRRRRPFHPLRLSAFLQSLGRISLSSIKDLAGVAETSGKGAPKTSIVRSKGFVWMATSSAAAYFMSHAGQYLEVVALGRWWADIPTADWPEGSDSEITMDFDGKFGDRRQEVVFIGQFEEKGPSSKQALEEVLDACLLSDAEMAAYEKIAATGDNALRKHFTSQ